MTEAEWNACTDPQPMLEFLRGKASERKLRLFACACCRRIWHLLADTRSQRAVEVAERFTDSAGNDEERRIVRADAQTACRLASHSDLFREPGVFSARAAYHVISNGHRSVLYAADSAASALAVLAGNKSPWEVRRSAARYGDQCDLLRDIVGNPSRPITLDPSWRTSTVAALAQAIYEERTFERLPILADALEDSGCADQEILTHCRGPRLHIRGCWVVDLLLCKQ